MAAWDDTFCWADRDEDITFDGTAFYECSFEQLLDTIDRAAARANEIADELHSLLEAEPALRSGDGQVGTDPLASRAAA